MTQKSLREESQEYVPKKTLNIADLEKVDISWPVETRSGEDKETGKPYTFKVMCVNQQEYRVPFTVFEEIKKMLKLRSDLKFVKVTKKGSGIGTKYEVEMVE